MRKLYPLAAAAYLDSEEVIAEYLNAALSYENPDVFLAAVRDVARAKLGQSAQSPDPY